MAERKAVLTAASFFATFSLAFGITAIFVVYYRNHYLQTISAGFLEYLILAVTDEVLIATGPIADVGKFLMIAIALVIVGFAMKGFDFKKEPKVKTLVTPWILLMTILLWIGVLVGIYVLVLNYTPDMEDTLRALFLTTNINQTIIAATGIIAFIELLVKIRKTT